MILSVSRRTDIPKFYMDWFMNRLHEGFVLVRNPMNHRQISRISLDKNVIDGIVFWTKDPRPVFKYLEELNEYNFYIQFTINSYDTDIETNLPPIIERVNTFKALSDKIGRERVVWRYSPVLFNDKYTYDYHIDQFKYLAKSLSAYTGECKLSFIEIYKKIKKTAYDLGISDIPEDTKNSMAQTLKKICDEHDIHLGACGNIDLEKAGIDRATCVDGKKIEAIGNIKLKDQKGTGSRDYICYCSPSIDIGSYDTCLNGCIYCYANSSETALRNKTNYYDVSSPILCDHIGQDDKITERKVTSLADPQLDLFDRLHQNI